MTIAATLAEICDALAGTLGASPLIEAVQSYNQLSEGINTLPTLQVYPQTWSGGGNGATSARTFGGGGKIVRVQTQVYNADIYVSQRKDLKNDMAACLAVIDSLDAIIDAQINQPFFGRWGIREFTWTGQLAALEATGIEYSGLRYVFTCTVY